MKKMCLLVAVIFAAVILQAQSVSINNDGSEAHPSAMLDVASNTKGILIPRLTSLQRGMIVLPANGLLVFDTDTNSFWYFSSGWKEISGGGNGAVQGPATGDLSGVYPSPNVVKIQNLPVAFGVPFDKQVMKWDMLSNQWKGANDSLFLPYNAVFSDPAKLFGITNTSLDNGGTAIYGKRTAAGSGIVPAFSMGVWGDNSNGAAVVGTSNSGIGAYGFSFQNHGAYGFSNAANFAGMYGTNSAPNGIGVMGEISTTGYAFYGKSTGSSGNAAFFENTNPANPNATLKVSNAGLGNGLQINQTNTLAPSAALTVNNDGASVAASLKNSNADNFTPVLYVAHDGQGRGIYSLLNNPLNPYTAITGTTLGSGSGIYGDSKLGFAGEFYTYNAANENETINVKTISKGSAAVFIKNNTGGSISDILKPAVLIDNNSKGNALKITSLHTGALNSAVDVNYDGLGVGMNVNSTKGGIHAHSGGTYAAVSADNYTGGTAIRGIAAGDTAAIYAENNSMFAVGMQSRVTGSWATAFKGTANSSSDVIHGINAGTGACIKGTTNNAAVGYAVWGETGSNSWGIPGYFISNNPAAITNTLWVTDNSLGQSLRIQVNNNLNASAALLIQHDGTGKLASFNNTSGERMYISNNGNMTSAGTLTVKNNKGIVRSSSATQMRMETASVQLVYFNMPVDGSTSVAVSFGTAFSSPPVVSVANIQSGFTGPCDKMNVQVRSVTTTGCTVTMYNGGVGGNPNVSGTWNLLAIGAE